MATGLPAALRSPLLLEELHYNIKTAGIRIRTSLPIASMPGRDKIVRDGWGSHTNFQASYGLRTTPEGLEEGNRILDAMMENDRRGDMHGDKSESKDCDRDEER
ncbi:hypothetical protein BZA05DRAFT_435893 [Tricharina praecox]|uniref:uncharacterized protein n=1 Tax=Tricharina praecox TaxID=43433 RepID=UPI00221F1CCE|nr:uncharacterized protein BZA05DRAFT_435893 [Tricharina praecox]KAI5853507.1 hypothetical protein BZA05DRAFT_435893 [Tricharina praecox]